MADETFLYFQQAVDVCGSKKEDKLPCPNSTLAENMREQPKATKLVYSPKRPTKTVGKSDENGKSLVKDTKVFKFPHYKKRIYHSRVNKCCLIAMKRMD